MINQLPDIPPNTPILIAGATASGKTSLAIKLAQTYGGRIVNADALQVYARWNIISARPSEEELKQAEHLLYGHIPHDQPYSVGHWLREVAPYLSQSPRPIIVGGTGLYFRALTQGLVDIPQIPDHIRLQANEMMQKHGAEVMLRDLDSKTTSYIDTLNPVRIQRAWEVQAATGKSLSEWHTQTPPPLLPLADCTPIHLDAPRDWLNARIRKRFELMLQGGALKEAEDNLKGWDPSVPSAKAIGAPELISHLMGEISLETATAKAITASQQYAKRQRTWFRSNMKDWHKVDAQSQ